MPVQWPRLANTTKKLVFATTGVVGGGAAAAAAIVVVAISCHFLRLYRLDICDTFYAMLFAFNHLSHSLLLYVEAAVDNKPLETLHYKANTPNLIRLLQRFYPYTN